MRFTEIAVIGAGPYGLSLAAHLQGAGVEFRILGRPMETWRDQMPLGMLLKSDGFASNLSDPEASFELGHFCREQAISYDATRVPVSLSTFVRYGLEFQRRLLPGLEEEKLKSLTSTQSGFLLALENGELFQARRVVLATGISYYSHVPEPLAGLPSEVVSHSSAVRDPGRYTGRSVAVVGSGASALDLAALLQEAGAEVTLLARRSELRFHNPPGSKPRSLWARLRAPGSGVGPGWKSRLLTDFPGLFRFLPVEQRLRIVRTYLGPSAGWPMRERVLGKVRTYTGASVVAANADAHKAVLTLSGGPAVPQQMSFDHVVAATGYKVDLERLPYLHEGLRRRIQCAGGYPVLSGGFESTMPGLFFVGISAAASFGPVMRFAFGAEYAAKTVTRRLVGVYASHPAQSRAPLEAV